MNTNRDRPVIVHLNPHKLKVKFTPCTGNEALYKPYGTYGD